jgi:hypothetical protein
MAKALSGVFGWLKEQWTAAANPTGPMQSWGAKGR